MVTKYLQITEDDHKQRAFAIAKAAGNQRYPRTTTTTVRESLGSGSPFPRPEIVHVVMVVSMAPDGVALRWRKRHH
jgi:hypothetical protein